jgi:O-antigen ligase
MIPRQALDKNPPWHSFGYGLAAVALGGGVGYVVTLLDNPFVAVVVLLGMLIGLISLINVEVGVLVLIAISFVRLSDVLVQDHGLPSIAKPFVALMLVGIALRWIFHRHPPRGWLRVSLLVGLYGLMVFLSLIYATDYETTFNALTDFLKDGIIAVIIVVLLQREEMFRGAIYALLGAGIFLGTLSVYQNLTGTFSNTYWGFATAGLMNIVGETSSYRISGPYGSPNVFSQIMVVMVPLALERLVNERSQVFRFIALWALVVTSLTVIFTYSRSGFISLVVVVLLFMFWRRTQVRTWLIFALLAVGLLNFLPEDYGARVGTLTDLISNQTTASTEVSFRGRTSETMIGWQMFMDHPVLGVGTKNYPVFYQEYSRKLGIDPRLEDRSPHSLYLEIAAEQGLVGIIIFSILIFSLFRGLFRSRKIFEKLGKSQMKNMAMAVTIGISGYLISAIFIHGSYPRPFWVLVGIALAFPVYAQSLVDSRQLEQVNG